MLVLMVEGNPTGNLVLVAVLEVLLEMVIKAIVDLLVLVKHFLHLLFLFICLHQIHIVQE